MTKYNGTYVVTQDNAVISNLEINGNVVIQADNVTMKNVKITSATYHAVQVASGATGFTLQDSEINGTGKTSNGIYGQGTFLRNDISGVENGITSDGNSSIRGNYIHDLLNTGSPHYDGIEVNSGRNIEIIGNTVIVDHPQTSAIMLDNYFGPLSNITVDGNRLEGGGYTVYLDGSFSGGPIDDSTIRITNNQIGGGQWGDFALYGNKPVMSGNTDLDTLPDTGTTPDPTPVPDTGGGSNPTPTPTPTPDPDDGTDNGSVYTGTSGNDSMPRSGQTNTGNETFKGLGGNDVIKGGAGADVIDGGSGTDTATYDGARGVKVDLLAGKGYGSHAEGDKLVGIENVTGSNNNDTLTGNDGNNVLNGSGGDDTLIGGKGYDTLSGGYGADKFTFRASSVATDGVDHITYFGSDDLINFDVTSGSTGKLSGRAFVSGTKALDSSDRFIFDKASNTLYYDKDGTGSSAQYKVAVIDNEYNLTADDIWLF